MARDGAESTVARGGRAVVGAFASEGFGVPGGVDGVGRGGEEEEEECEEEGKVG